MATTSFLNSPAVWETRSSIVSSDDDDNNVFESESTASDLRFLEKDHKAVNAEDASGQVDDFSVVRAAEPSVTEKFQESFRNGASKRSERTANQQKQQSSSPGKVMTALIPPRTEASYDEDLSYGTGSMRFDENDHWWSQSIHCAHSGAQGSSEGNPIHTAAAAIQEEEDEEKQQQEDFSRERRFPGRRDATGEAAAKQPTNSSAPSVGSPRPSQQSFYGLVEDIFDSPKGENETTEEKSKRKFVAGPGVRRASLEGSSKLRGANAAIRGRSSSHSTLPKQSLEPGDERQSSAQQRHSNSPDKRRSRSGSPVKQRRPMAIQQRRQSAPHRAPNSPRTSPARRGRTPRVDSPQGSTGGSSQKRRVPPAKRSSSLSKKLEEEKRVTSIRSSEGTATTMSISTKSASTKGSPLKQKKIFKIRAKDLALEYKKDELDEVLDMAGERWNKDKGAKQQQQQRLPIKHESFRRKSASGQAKVVVVESRRARSRGGEGPRSSQTNSLAESAATATKIIAAEEEANCSNKTGNPSPRGRSKARVSTQNLIRRLSPERKQKFYNQVKALASTPNNNSTTSNPSNIPTRRNIVKATPSEDGSSSQRSTRSKSLSRLSELNDEHAGKKKTQPSVFSAPNPTNSVDNKDLSNATQSSNHGDAKRARKRSSMPLLSTTCEGKLERTPSKKVPTKTLSTGEASLSQSSARSKSLSRLAEMSKGTKKVQPSVTSAPNASNKSTNGEESKRAPVVRKRASMPMLSSSHHQQLDRAESLNKAPPARRALVKRNSQGTEPSARKPRQLPPVIPPPEIALPPPSRSVQRTVSEVSDDGMFVKIRRAGVTDEVLQALTDQGLMIVERKTRK